MLTRLKFCRLVMNKGLRNPEYVHKGLLGKGERNAGSAVLMAKGHHLKEKFRSIKRMP